eukprot:10767437-Alexandrium_andersonii.AAC.1
MASVSSTSAAFRLAPPFSIVATRGATMPIDEDEEAAGVAPTCTGSADAARTRAVAMAAWAGAAPWDLGYAL